MSDQLSREQAWPALPFDAWADSCATLHMWAQIVGKIRLRESAPINHGWHSTLYVTARGLTTSPIPHGLRTFQIDFDFIDHALVIDVSDGTDRAGGARAADRRVVLPAGDGRAARARTSTCTSTPGRTRWPIRFPSIATRCIAPTTPTAVNRFWRVLVQSDRVFKQFRSGFIGKCSPVHFFWGALDLAVTRFSGRRAPEHPGGIPNLPDRVTREAYSHEVSSGGFWAGGGPIAYPGVLRLRVSGAGGVCGRPGRAERGVLQHGSSRVHPAVRRGADVGRPRPHAARVPAVDLRRRGGPREVGSRGARVLVSLRRRVAASRTSTRPCQTSAATLAIDSRTLRSTSSSPRGGDHPSPRPMP